MTRLAPASSAFGDIREAVTSAHHHHGRGTGGRLEWRAHTRARGRGIAWGALAGVGLLLVYVVVLWLANSLEHVLDELVRLWPWMLPIVGGFAVQVGLFAYVRAATSGPAAADSRGVVASGSASTVSMIACCAHHLTDVLPLIGLAGAAVFLVSYQSLFLLLGVLSNLVGVVYVLGIVRRHGLFPRAPSIFARVARRPFDRAFACVLAASAVTFATAVVLAFT